MPTRICSKPGCPTIHDSTTDSRCPTHAKQARTARDKDRTQYKTAGHTQRFRPGVLDRDSICVLCNVRASTVADHYPKERQDLVDLGMDPDDPANGRGLCASCHGKTTSERTPGGWNRRG